LQPKVHELTVEMRVMGACSLGTIPDFQMQSTCSPLPVKYCEFSSEHASLNTFSTKALFLMLQKQTAKEGFHHHI
jgi:hypothetical protein